MGATHDFATRNRLLWGVAIMGRAEMMVPAAGLVALWLVVRAGCFRRSALSGAPQRYAGLGAADLAVGLAIMGLGMIVAQHVLQRMGAWSGQSAAVGGDGQNACAMPNPRQFLGQALVGQALVHLPVAVYLGWRCAATPGGLEQAGLVPSPLRLVRDGLAALSGVLVSVPMALGLGVVVTVAGQWLLGQPAPEVGHEMLGVLQRSSDWWVTAGLVASAVVVAPVLEEAIFRGLAQTALLTVIGPSRRWSVVILASGAFTVVHVGVAWQVLPSLFVLGVVLGWLYERTGSLLPSVLVHAGFNTVNIAMAFLQMAVLG